MTINLKSLTLSLFVICLCFNAKAQDWRAELQEPTVTVENGTYSSEEHQEITVAASGGAFKISYSAKSPSSLMHRDKFSAIYHSVTLMVTFSIFTQAGLNLDDVEFNEIKNPTEKADIGIHLEMTESGIRIDITTEEGTESENMSWEEFFE